MTNRIAARMGQLRSAGGKSLSVVIMLGDPDFGATLELVRIAADQGVDVVELGIPIETPFLDSSVMRESMQRALAFCRDPQPYLQTIGQLRSTFPALPLEVMIYHDTLMGIGLRRFCQAMEDAGVDAVLVADGVDQSDEFRRALDEELFARGIYPIRFVPHPFRPQQIDDLRRNGRGFIVVQTRTDEQGRRDTVLDANGQTLAELRQAGVDQPLVLAYGIRTPADVRKCIALGADGVLIGTVVLDAAYRLPRAEFAALLASLREAAVAEEK